MYVFMLHCLFQKITVHCRLRHLQEHCNTEQYFAASYCSLVEQLYTLLD